MSESDNELVTRNGHHKRDIDHLRANQQHRERRGHDFYPPLDVWEATPTIAEVDEVEDLLDATVHAHYFVGACDWWVIGLDSELARGYGYVCLGDRLNAEWGTFSLTEIEHVVVPPFFVVERDNYWEPGKARDVIPLLHT